ncbi:protein nervous wreck isoform X2 [Anopheles stephensi]|uniref:protein nervous wreck isoform X2 n=1 Tax=Anopheles stephensi TaxID=30069 RepID=UPI001658A276|nr:protein nervous wreck isoform X2 [Anopheles stephensi]XP_035917247.1 protein nervous wreck isoform X2 [Anopheles stephensi]XP_035917248.1 protein nervous wreck isoform X2 [Anopheles stephensi]XP_035917249.1 protein nervous wreck isoform X2 [Anopheles stephensi]XP_035917250.1 protein nervous wreck isoform X2 [Anopheles stephensi]
MQPPPRKGNYTKFLKNLHTEQLAKLALKNQNECELLEDIRQFTLKRSAIEKSYSEALLKISSAYLNKKQACIPEIKMDGADEKWNMWSVWQTVLEENEKLARARLAAVEVFQQQIADEAKVLRSTKLNSSKRCIENLGVVQKELQNSVTDVDKTKKIYFDEEHSAHDVRDKARDIEEKLKKKKGSFFQSITSLQKNSARVTSRKEQLEEKSTGARNDYILSLAAANAHQNRYFTIDLQTTMATMENYVYERVADYLALIGRTELLTCSATQNSFGKIRDQAQQLTREYNLQCCYLYYPVLKQHIQYEFEPCDNDPVRKITADHESAAETLSREGKRWAGRVARESNVIRECARKLAVCTALREAGHRNDPNDQNGPDLETKIEEFRENIRKSEIAKAKAEARLECLRIGGINVDEWIQEAETLSVQEMPRSASSLSMRTDASGQGENPSSDSFYDSDNAEQDQPVSESSPAPKQPEPPMDEFTADSDEDEEFGVEQERQKIEQISHGWDDPTQVDWGAEEAAAAAAASSSAAAEAAVAAAAAAASAQPREPAGQTFKCTALYSYTAQNPDELTIVESEQLEVVGEGDGDGWLRARNYRGEEGFVPHNYLDVERDTPVDTHTPAQLSSQISFSSVDYTVDNEDQDQMQDSGQSPDQISVISAPRKVNNQLYCVALYDYDATAEDELTFEEGQIIKLITKSPHGVDDGWWEGELMGKIGNFPSLVVEECDENGEPLTDAEDESPPPSAPPTFAAPAPPPPMILHEATPPEGQSPNLTNAGPAIDKFEFELNNDQHEQYGTQFSAPPPSQPPPVVICEDPEGEEAATMEEESRQGATATAPAAPAPPATASGDDSNQLNFAQIIVTAATPMHEEPDKKFPPAEAPTTTATDDEPSEIVEKQERETQEISSKQKSQDAEVPKPPTPPSQQPTKPKTAPPPKPAKPPSPPKPEKPATAPKPTNVVAKTVTAKKPERVRQGATVPEPDPEPEPDHGEATPIEDPVAPFEANFEANFEAGFAANFDDAFGQSSQPEVPKQVVGGRASIPEELEPDQLARLQNLKESNA